DRFDLVAGLVAVVRLRHERPVAHLDRVRSPGHLDNRSLTAELAVRLASFAAELAVRLASFAAELAVLLASFDAVLAVLLSSFAAELAVRLASFAAELAVRLASFAEVRGEPLGVDRRRGDDHLEIRALRQELLQVPENEVDVEAALVR